MFQHADVDQIYIPPLPDLIVLQDELIAQYTKLTSRALKAVDIIAERRLAYDPAINCWTAETKRDGGKLYLLQGQKCTCPDYNSTFSPVAGNQRLCKHKLAKRIYTEHLERQIQDRLLDLVYVNHTTEGALHTDGVNLYDAHQPRQICRIRRDKARMVRLFDSAAIHQFSLWMGEQITHGIPAKEPQIPALALA